MPTIKVKKEDGSWGYVTTASGETSSIELDNTLKIEGMAADSKAVGDAIDNIVTQIEDAGSIDIDLGGSNTGDIPSAIINADTLGGKTESELSVAKAVDADNLSGNSLDDVKSYVNSQITNRVIHSGGKNLLKNTAKSKTTNGITFTVNEDGSVAVNGTATKNAELILSEMSLDNTLSYILTGCPAGGSDVTYKISIRFYDSNGNMIDTGSDPGNGRTISNSNYELDSSSYIHFVILIAAGTTANNMVFYPMLRLASEADNTYEPYYEGLSNITPDSIGAMNKMELLWENASPTSSFAAQNISFTYSDFDELLFLFNTSNSTYQRIAPNIVEAKNGSKGCCMHPYYSSDKMQIRYREFELIESGCSFTSGFNNGSTYDNGVIPVRVYGIKGVIA